MFSKVRQKFETTPTIFGQPIPGQDGERFAPHQDVLTHAAQMGVAQGSRHLVDTQKVKRMALRTHEGLLAAVRTEFPLSTAKEPGAVKDPKSLAIVQAHLHGAEQDQTDHPMGRTGALAQNLEMAGLKIEKTHPGDKRAIELYNIAAAAHNLASRETASKGFENGLVTEAAAQQKRDPRHVARDLVSHGLMDPKDPRGKVRIDDVNISKEEAKNRTRLVGESQPTQKTPDLALAKATERKAIKLHQNDGPNHQVERLLSGAFALENQRQMDRKLAAQQSQQKPAATLSAGQER